MGNVSEVKVVGLQGVRMNDGRFIFMWIDGELRKMVLTENDGTQIAAGYLDKPENDWRDENTWYSGSYEINNFQGIAKGKSSSLLCNNLNFHCTTVETLNSRL